jgi:hypothetical protein
VKTVKTVLVAAACLSLLVPAAAGCDHVPTTDEKQAFEQAQSLEQAHAQIGMPAIGDFSEKRFVKDIYELRDKPTPTHSYIVNEMTGCLLYLGPSIGYGLPYATQYTSPTRTAWYNGSGGGYQVPQAEPNGLFMPTSAEGTWVMLRNPSEDKVQPVYIEPRVLVSPFRLPDLECRAAAAEAPAARK